MRNPFDPIFIEALRIYAQLACRYMSYTSPALPLVDILPLQYIR